MAGKKKTGSGKKKEAPKKDETAPDTKMGDIVKEIETAMFSIKFYPVAVSEEKKRDAVEKIRSIYMKGDENIRQLLLYMIHEALATSSELKFMRNYEHFRARTPNREATQLRMNVYRAMFNYNTSLEGLVEFIKMLGAFNKGDDAAKVLTYHYAHLCTMENEANHVLRNAIIDALGDSESGYALDSLLSYAKYTDNERLLHRILASLAQWDEKIDNLDTTDAHKEKLRSSLTEVMTRELGGTQYG
ncbi:MAG: hypothetical protein ABII71_02350 [Candidatus Micrarchaeota archaeon]